MGADGKWSVDVPLSPNVQHTLTFGAQDTAGNILPAGNPVIITTDTQAPPAPIVTIIDNNGTLVSGTAEPCSTVIIRNGTTVLGRAVADSITGAYTVTISPAQTTGEALNAIAQIRRATKAEKRRLPPQTRAFRTHLLCKLSTMSLPV